MYGSWTGHNYREYIIGELNDSLKSNRHYCGEFYTSLSNYSKGALEDMGMYFSIDTVLVSSTFGGLFSLYPQIENHKGIIIDTISWVKVNGSFIANGGEKYVTIGNFKDNAHTNYIEVSYGPDSPYYFIDDVLVCECSFQFNLGNDTTLCDGETLLLNPNMPNAIYTWQDSSHAATYTVTKPGNYWVRVYFPDYSITTSSSINVTSSGDCLTIPNIFTPNNDGFNDNFEILNSEGWNIDVQIFDRWGIMVYKNTDYKNNWDGNNAVDGTYYYIIKATNQLSGYKKEYHGSVTILK